MKTKYVVLGLVFLVAILLAGISFLAYQLERTQEEVNELRNTTALFKELETARAEIKILKEELSSLREKFFKVSKELNETKITIPPPKLLNETIDYKKITEIMAKVASRPGSISSVYRITTKEEIERFLATIKYPSNLDEVGKPWYLMAKFIEWTAPNYISVGLGHGYGGRLPYTLAVMVITHDEDYEIFWIKDTELVKIQPGDFETLVIHFP